MSSIAYVTDSKLLEYHRLNQNTEMNFWRLNPNMKFSDFKEGDLLFFLSKDKDFKRKGEKGIVGYGRCEDFHSASIKTMWNKYGTLNGYTSFKDFKEAILKVTKDNKVPSKIGSIYLKDVIFFASPVYLSDCGKKISKSIESYTYIDDGNSFNTFNVLDNAKEVIDIWTSGMDAEVIIEKEEIRSVLYYVYNTLNYKYPKLNESKKIMKKFLDENKDYALIKNSKVEAYKIEENNLYLAYAPLLIKDKMMERRILLGQELLYKKMFDELYPFNLNIIFKLIGE